MNETSFQNPPNEIWIIGGGKFGTQAARKLHRKKSTRIVIIDNRSEALSQIDIPVQKTCAEGIDFLKNRLNPDNIAVPEWIVPAAPFHLAYAWIDTYLNGKITQLPIPDPVINMLPNPFKGRNGEVYISNADFICPENCPEPENICTFTKQPRPRFLYRFLENLKVDGYRSIVIRSHQLAPGAGGYSPKSLFDVLKTVRNTTEPILLSTSCGCHAVMHAFRR